MRTTYRLELNDGFKVDIKADSAAEAIQECLWTHRGFTVASCHTGLTKEEAQYTHNKDGVRGVPGLVWHEVPPHQPIPEGIQSPVKFVPAPASAPLFDESALIEESRRAKERSDHGPL